MAIAPDSRYYVHVTARTAQVEQRYLVDQAGGSQTQASNSTRGTWFDLRTDWRLVLALVALAAGIALLVAIVG